MRTRQPRVAGAVDVTLFPKKFVGADSSSFARGSLPSLYERTPSAISLAILPPTHLQPKPIPSTEPHPTIYNDQPRPMKGIFDAITVMN